MDETNSGGAIKSDKPKSQLNFKDAFNIPNCICYFRILCVPAFVALTVLARQNINLVWWALGVFLAASGSDLVDGWFARKFNMVTGIGKVLDPLADKLMHISVLLALSFALWYVHWAFALAIFVKEFLMIILALFFMSDGVQIQANMLGKVGSATISAGVILAFFTPLVDKTIAAPFKYSVNPIFIAVCVVLSLAVALTYAAAINYLIQVLKQRKLIREGKLADAAQREEEERLAKQAQKNKD
ncbi:MAG TPA: CDP-alcohol phosphatidyltransferase family protein [Eubacteriales bacterium]|jgi:cardiolipin synthase|nr:CDP-alcohol phosphatidyltransferase family protein [Eubacteriales bacterium]HRU84250.1 CDP-alcohol phosphatidyltransferase family protein [Eubacteriales bacterium]